MICEHCGNEHSRDGRLCFRCHVRGVSFTFRGGAVRGRNGFHTTKGDWLREHMEVDSEKELARNPNVERA